MAPIIPTAMYNAAGDNAEGTSPFAAPIKSGFAMIISARKLPPMVATKTKIKASILRIPYRCNNMNKKVSVTVMMVPYIKGKPVNNLIPIAIPKTSAKSVAAIANSASRYKQKLTNLG